MGNEVFEPANPKDNIKTAFYRPFLLAILIAAVGIMAVLLWPFRHALVIALVLATLMSPLRTRLPLLLRKRRLLSATAMTLLTILFVLLPLSALLALLTGESIAFSKTALAWFKAGGLNDAAVWVQDLHLPGWAKSYFDLSSIDFQKIESWALSSGGDIGLWFVWAGKGIAGVIANIGLQLLVMVLFLFYFLAEGEHIRSMLRKASPLRRDQEDKVISRFKAVSQAVLLGGLGTSMAIGMVSGIGLWIVGINPLLWGAVAVIASLIPVVGMSFVMIPSIVYLIASDSIKMAIFLLLYWLLVVNSVDNVVRPLFMRGKARMSLVWVFVSIIGGILTFGPLGILYGPLALSFAFVLFQIFLDAQEEDMPSPKS
ncbi:AI-2E family transporter [Desulfocurvibacter africanus]|uniref:AI-2E family transporter n=1 Tax=Desulfocurvibacter africanus TaxID=873 RepID=UPI002FDB519F